MADPSSLLPTPSSSSHFALLLFLLFTEREKQRAGGRQGFEHQPAGIALS